MPDQPIAAPPAPVVGALIVPEPELVAPPSKEPRVSFSIFSAKIQILIKFLSLQPMLLGKIHVFPAGVSQIRLVKSTTVLTPTQQQQLERINQSGQISNISGISGQLTGQIQGIQSISGLQGIQGIQGIQSIQGIQGISGIQGIAGKMAPKTYQLIKTAAGMGLQTISPGFVGQKKVSFDFLTSSFLNLKLN